MNIILEELYKQQKFKEYIKTLNEKISPIKISGLSDVGKIEFIAGTIEKSKRPIAIITYNEIQAKNIIKDLSNFIDIEEIDFFPKREIVSYDFDAESQDLPFERIQVLNNIKDNKSKVIITTIEAIMQKMIGPSTLYKNVFSLKVGETHNLQKIKERLVQLGYERRDLVEARCQFSVRGDIVDIALDDKNGVRIEFWGDDVDSIRKFSLSSQRSDTMLDETTIYPAHELLLEESLEIIANRIIENNFEDLNDIKMSQKDKKEYLSRLNEIINQDAEIIREGDYLNKVDKYFNDFYLKQSTFLDYLSKDYTVLIDENSKVNNRQENIIIENNNLIKSLIEKRRFIPQSIKNISKYKYEIEDKQVVYLEKQDIGIANSSFVFNYRNVNYFKNETELLFDDIRKNMEDKKIFILAGGEEEANKFGALLTQNEIKNSVLTSSMINKKSDASETKVFVLTGKLNRRI